MRMEGETMSYLANVLREAGFDVFEIAKDELVSQKDADGMRDEMRARSAMNESYRKRSEKAVMR